MPTPSFILDLRTKIGTDLLCLPGVTAAVFDEQDRVLLVRRADNRRWTLVTGCLDPGEQPAAGAVREVLEEARVTAVAERVLAVEALPPSVCPNGDKVQFVDTAFRCRYVSGTAGVGDDESVDVAWFDPADLPESVPERMRRCIAYALDGDPRAKFES